jgi:hypothetical protein
MAETTVCVMCKVRSPCGTSVDRSRPARSFTNPVDKLTSTVSWPTIWSKYCYYCEKKANGLIRL